MSRRAWAAVAVLAALAVGPAAARAQDEDLLGPFSNLNYTAAGGIMAGVGPQGTALRRGPYASLSAYTETAMGMQLGIEGAYASSNDIFNTKFVSLGAIARLSPMPEDYRIYVQLGAAAYRVSYRSAVAGLSVPDPVIRPGGSFGLGLDVLELSRFAVGGIVAYHGVVIGTHNSRSYLVGALTVSLKPSPY